MYPTYFTARAAELSSHKCFLLILFRL